MHVGVFYACRCISHTKYTHTYTYSLTHTFTPCSHTHTHTRQCEEAHPCYDGVQCVEYDDGYECAACPSGFLGNGLRGYDLVEAGNRQVSDDMTVQLVL